MDGVDTGGGETFDGEVGIAFRLEGITDGISTVSGAGGEGVGISAGLSDGE